MAALCMGYLFSGTAGAADLIDPMRPQNHKVGVTDGRDDEAALAAEAKRTADWCYAAVLLSAKRKVAVINGHALKVGEVLEGYRLVSIKTDQVVLRGKGRELILHRTGTGLKKNTRSSLIGVESGSVGKQENS